MQIEFELMKLIEFLIFLILTTSIIIFLVKIYKAKTKKEKLYKKIIIVIINVFLMINLLIFAFSHKTYFKYNDWAILGSNIDNVREKYGEFDRGYIKHGESGEVAYYIYTDNSPIMPDHSAHYYFICYDKDGIVHKVYEDIPSGG